jgi:uncharacterized membrane protein SpoIIM required for sporulation
MNASMKQTPFPYQSILILALCFVVTLISINQIIELAKPNTSSYSSQSDRDYLQMHSITTDMVNVQGQDYKNFTGQLSAKFPTQPDIAKNFKITPEIAELPKNEQGNEIRFRLLESRIEYLQNELAKISQSQSESLIYKLAFYFWGFLVWMCSIVIGRVLEHLTDRFNIKYLGQNVG